MTHALWPTSVRQPVLRDGFNRSPLPANRVTKTEKGRPKRRKTATGRAETIALSQNLGRDEYIAFEVFVRDTLVNGTKPFIRWHPYFGTGYPVICEFNPADNEPPFTQTLITGGRVQVTYTLLIISDGPSGYLGTVPANLEQADW